MKSSLFYLSFLFIFLFTSKLVAQDYQIHLGDEENTNGRTQFQETALTTNDGNVLILHSQLKYHNYHFVVNKMELVLNHSNLQEIKRVPINIDEKNAYAPKLFKIGNSLVIFYVFYDDSQKLNTLVSLKINENDFAIEEKKIFGIAKRNKADFNFLAVNNIPQILPEYRYTPNKKQLVVYFQVKEEKDPNETLALVIFNEKIETVWTETIEFPIKSKLVKIDDVALSNDATVFVTIQESEYKNNPGFKSLLFRIDQTGTLSSAIQLNKNNFFQKTKMCFKNNDTLILASLTKNRLEGRMQGVSFMQYDLNSKKITHTSNTLFQDDLIALVDSDGFGKANGKDAGISNNFKTDYLLKRKNGSFDLISEYYYKKSITAGDKIEVTYGDIINCHLSASGDVQVTRIPKLQEDVGTYRFCSYFPMIQNNTLHLFFNDSKKNTDNKITDKPQRILYYSKGLLRAYQLDENGALSQQIVYDYKDGKYTFTFFKVSKASDSIILLEAIEQNMGPRRKTAIIEIK